MPGFFIMVQCLTIVAMMTQIISLILICQNLFLTDKSADQDNLTPQFEEFIGWLTIELWNIIGIIASNSVFLFFRSIFAQRSHLSVSVMAKHENTDFLEGQQVLTTLYNSLMAPIFINIAIRLKFPNESTGYWILDYQLPFAVFQAVTSLYLIFASFHTAWDFMQSWWIFVGPVIHAVFAILDFVVIPLAIIIQIFVSGKSVSDGLFTAGLWIYPLLCFGILGQFVLQVLPIFMGALNYTRKLQRQHRQRKGAKTAEEWDLAMADNTNANNEYVASSSLIDNIEVLRGELFPTPICYFEQSQDPGCGPKRIKTPFCLREDLYALLYISQVKPMIKDEALRVSTEKQAAIDTLIENQIVVQKSTAINAEGAQPAAQVQPELLRTQSMINT